MKQDTYIVILAGGKGERLWPLSRKTKPKQLLPFHHAESLLEQTVERICPFTKRNQRLIVTSEQYKQPIEQLVGNKVNSIIVEPASCNTGPAVLYTCLTIAQQHPDAVAVFLPADHTISPQTDFEDAVHTAVTHAQEHDVLCLLGVQPKTPATGYGYIECAHINHNCPSSILRFVEKPSLPKAQEYLQKKTMLWNIGIFCGTVSRFIKEYQRTAPELYAAMQEFMAGRGVYSSLPSISIDHAVLEKSAAIAVLPVQFAWSDVGNLETFLTQGSYLEHIPAICIDSKNNIIHADSKLVALIGIEDLCIIQTSDVLVVAKRSDVEKVKSVVQELHRQSRQEFL